MSETKLDELERLWADLPYFCEEKLKVLDKGGHFVPLKLNSVQLLLHERIEKQRAETGWVRVLVLKARRMGVSTYVGARYYQKATLCPGRNVYVQAHTLDSTEALFQMVDRFQRNYDLAPRVGASNAKELTFPKLDSSYAVATAGQKAGGRGRTIQLYHGSEVPFWPNAADHFASSIQAVSLVRDTEVILEGTANGPSGEFYERWQKAEAGIGDYIAVFIPWFLDSDNTRAAPADFEVNREAEAGRMSEAEMVEMFGLTNDQLEWRRGKILDLGSEDMFCQEYPSTSQEAFVNTEHEPFIPPLLVMRAQKRQMEPHGPLILGVDPAGMGGDRFAVAARRGYSVLWIESRTKIDAQEGIAWVRELIDTHQPARVNVDAGGGGNGHAIVTGLRHLGPKYDEIVRGVNFGGTAQAKLANPKKPGPKNRRMEMWQRLKEWLEDPVGASLPTRTTLASDISAPQKKPTTSGDWQLESKIDMKKRGVRSPDEGDAVVLTFASNELFQNYHEPAAPPPVDRRRSSTLQRGSITGPCSWMT